MRKQAATGYGRRHGKRPNKYDFRRRGQVREYRNARRNHTQVFDAYL